MPYLIHKNPDGSTNQYWDLHGPPTTVGRSTKVNAQVDDPKLSAAHFTITPTPDGQFTLKDLGSSNGTQVNNQPVTEYVLKPNDTIQAGQSKFLFMEGLTTISRKLDEDLKALDRIAAEEKKKKSS